MSVSQQATRKKPVRKKMKKYLNMLKGILAIIGAVTVVLIIGYLFEHQLYYRGIQKKLDSGYTLYIDGVLVNSDKVAIDRYDIWHFKVDNKEKVILIAA